MEPSEVKVERTWLLCGYTVKIPDKRAHWVADAHLESRDISIEDYVAELVTRTLNS